MRNILILLIVIAACVLLVAAIHSHAESATPAPVSPPQEAVKLEALPKAASLASTPEPAPKPVPPPAPSLLARVLAGEDIPENEAQPAGAPAFSATSSIDKPQTTKTYLDLVLNGESIPEWEKLTQQ